MTNEDYKAVYNQVQALLDGALRQNEALIQGLKYYADTDWRDLSLVDRGELARKIIREVAA